MNVGSCFWISLDGMPLKNLYMEGTHDWYCCTCPELMQKIRYPVDKSCLEFFCFFFFGETKIWSVSNPSHNFPVLVMSTIVYRRLASWMSATYSLTPFPELLLASRGHWAETERNTWKFLLLLLFFISNKMADHFAPLAQYSNKIKLTILHN